MTDKIKTAREVAARGTELGAHIEVYAEVQSKAAALSAFNRARGEGLQADIHYDREKPWVVIIYTKKEPHDHATP